MFVIMLGGCIRADGNILGSDHISGTEFGSGRASTTPHKLHSLCPARVRCVHFACEGAQLQRMQRP